jgi:transcriptional regulator with XRE-family HTH domain
MPRRPEGSVSRIVRANIKRIRTAQGLSQDQLAAKAQVAGRFNLRQPTIVRIEQGLRPIDVDDLAAFATAFGVRPEHLLVPFECPQCTGKPASGFICRICGAEGP